MPKVTYILSEDRGEICTVEQDAVPRVGDSVDIYKASSGLQEIVRSVWWRVDEDFCRLDDVVVELHPSQP